MIASATSPANVDASTCSACGGSGQTLDSCGSCWSRCGACHGTGKAATSSQPANVDASVIASSKSISETERRPAEAETVEVGTEDSRKRGDANEADSTSATRSGGKADNGWRVGAEAQMSQHTPTSLPEGGASKCYKCGGEGRLPVGEMDECECPACRGSGLDEPAPTGGYPNGSLADEVLKIVFAFDSSDSRRDAVRELAARVSNLEVSRCNAPEPSATVPRSEVEEIAKRIEGKASLALYTEDRRAYLDALSLVRALVDRAKKDGEV